MSWGGGGLKQQTKRGFDGRTRVSHSTSFPQSDLSLMKQTQSYPKDATTVIARGRPPTSSAKNPDQRGPCLWTRTVTALDLIVTAY